jgi:DNA-directed RNA polymerase subunit omega
MARVTVEDCVTRIPNRFELVMIAAQRARNLGAGAALTIDRDNDKNPVIALREIAEQTVDLAGLEDDLIRSLQKFVEPDQPDEEEISVIAMAGDEGMVSAQPDSGEEVAEDNLYADADEGEGSSEDGSSALADIEGDGMPKTRRLRDSI